MTNFFPHTCPGARGSLGGVFGGAACCDNDASKCTLNKMVFPLPCPLATVLYASAGGLQKDRHMSKQSAEPSSAPAAAERTRPSIVTLTVLVLMALVVIGTGVAVAETSSGPASYACMSISHQGNTVQLTTTGLLHYAGSQYYISCNEGSNLPSGQYKSSCLTISPKKITPTIGLGAPTEYYYLSSSGGALTLHGASAPANSTEWIATSGISLSASC
jgi:hypothetical protein